MLTEGARARGLGWLQGSAGQSFACFLVAGMRIKLTGEANDYVGKGMAGGEVVIVPPPGSRFAPEEASLVGNTCLYGATGGRLFVNGRAGEGWGPVFACYVTVERCCSRTLLTWPSTCPLCCPSSNRQVTLRRKCLLSASAIACCIAQISQVFTVRLQQGHMRWVLRMLAWASEPDCACDQASASRCATAWRRRWWRARGTTAAST